MTIKSPHSSTGPKVIFNTNAIPFRLIFLRPTILFIKNEFLEEKRDFHDEETIKYKNININLTRKIAILTDENKKLQRSKRFNHY